jgi:transcriptional regulator with XRE-family HTH domain
MNGEKLKKLREASGKTQPELAKEIGVANSSISFWENEVNEPKAEFIYRLAKFFGVTSDYLLGLEDDFGNRINEGNPARQKQMSEAKLSDTDQKILKELKDLPEEYKPQILGYIHGFKQTIKTSVKKTNPAEKNGAEILQ